MRVPQYIIQDAEYVYEILRDWTTTTPSPDNDRSVRIAFVYFSIRDVAKIVRLSEKPVIVLDVIASS